MFILPDPKDMRIAISELFPHSILSICRNSTTPIYPVQCWHIALASATLQSYCYELSVEYLHLTVILTYIHVSP